MSKILNPKTLNTVHIKIMEFADKEYVNYNLIIDIILQLSPAYGIQGKAPANKD